MKVLEELKYIFLIFRAGVCQIKGTISGYITQDP